MKTKPIPLSRSYLAALRKHLKAPSSLSLAAARRLGLKAVSLHLETLDLAKIHEDALIEVFSPETSLGSGKDLIRHACTFFAEAVTPIEETHRGARKANTHLKAVNESLTQRTIELATSNGELKHEIVRRKVVEDSLRTSEQTTSKLLQQSRQLQEELRHLSRRLLSVQEEERKRISRELHDVVAQTLTSINVRLATLKSQTTANVKDLHKKIAITQRLVERSVDLIHRFARDLRPTVLDDLGLLPALQSYMKGFMERTGIRVTFTAFSGIEKLDSAKRTVLYRIAQEGLTNIARHSKASQAEVTITQNKNGIRMDIHDNGKGFNVEGAVFAKSSKRLGLLGMRERVEMVGGTFCVCSAPGKETTLEIEMPHGTTTTQKKLKKKSASKTLQCP